MPWPPRWPEDESGQVGPVSRLKAGGSVSERGEARRHRSDIYCECWMCQEDYPWRERVRDQQAKIERLREAMREVEGMTALEAQNLASTIARKALDA